MSELEIKNKCTKINNLLFVYSLSKHIVLKVEQRRGSNTKYP